jgi:hypothetical protein
VASDLLFLFTFTIVPEFSTVWAIGLERIFILFGVDAELVAIKPCGHVAF